MEKAYILLVHKNPDHLYRLINRLDDNHSTFFIHIDIKANLNSFKNLEDYGNKIVYVKREDGRWGGFGIVQAAINGLQAIKDTNKHFDSIHLLSGQDYPIKSNEYINMFLRNSPHSIFMSTYGALPLERWGGKRGGFYRIELYFFRTDKWHFRLLKKFMNFSKRFIPLLRKKIPYGLTIYGGSQWWTIDMYALNFILDYHEKHPKLSSFFKTSLLSDEMFFQTILQNSQDERILNSMAPDNKRLIVIPPANPHPITFRKTDFDTILKSDALFGRKFDADIDDEIINLVDKHCLNI